MVVGTEVGARGSDALPDRKSGRKAQLTATGRNWAQKRPIFLR